MNANNNFPTPIAKYSLWEKIVLSFYCVRFYTFSVFFPVGLRFHYKYPFQPDQAINWFDTLFPVLFLTSLIFILFKIQKSKNSAFYFFCMLGFLVHIGLVLQIIRSPDTQLWQTGICTFRCCFFFYPLLLFQ